MTPDVISAEYQGGYRIKVTFEDGKTGVVDFSKYRDRGGIFARFGDLAFFRRFRVNEELGVLSWNDGLDIAPETLYSEATGAPLPSWMERPRGRKTSRGAPARRTSRRASASAGEAKT